MTCLKEIEPYLVLYGVLVIDDYYDWSGCRVAVDEYFKDKKDKYLFLKKTKLHLIRMK
jgi:asparagine synthase (glutamine-hydrolysing)